MKARSRSSAARLLAATLVVGVVRLGHAAPVDVLQSPVPILGSDPPKAHALRDGDASVSTQTGALQYSYPITVPPGRLGNEPHLALSYSSQAPLFGGIAAGWSLSIPTIRLDTSQGRLAPMFLKLWDPDPARFDTYLSTMAGSRPLVSVNEPTSTGVAGTYRAQNDSSFTRYERMQLGQPFAWRASSSDGTTYYFGDSNLITGSTFADVVPLTRTEDQFGNRVEYQWDATFNNDPHITEIRYTSNPAAGLPAFAKVDFAWTPQSACAGDTPTGAANDFRDGVQHYFGANKLTQIVATAFDPVSGTVQHTRQITLGYSAESESCNAKHGPLRLLTSIQESAWGPNAPRVDLPPVTFAYGDTSIGTTVTTTTPRWTSFYPLTYGTRYYDFHWPTMDGMMLDLDGDGLIDHLHMLSTGTDCQVVWDKNTGSGFVSPQVITLPTLPWAGTSGERCSLSAQLTMFNNNPPGHCDGAVAQASYFAYHWFDMNGDGLPDLVAGINYDPQAYDPGSDPSIQWPACDGSSTGGSCVVPDDTCLKATFSCPSAGSAGGGSCTMDYASAEACLKGQPHVACSLAAMGQGGGSPGAPGGATTTNPGVQQCFHGPVPYQRCSGRYPWFIYWNQGNGQLAQKPDIKYEPVPVESDTGDSALGGTVLTSGSSAVIDVDGDGYLDALLPHTTADFTFWEIFRGGPSGQFQSAAPGTDHGWVWLAPHYGEPGGYTNYYKSGVPGTCSANQSAEGYSQLTDMNGDGLVDLVWQWRPYALDPSNPVQIFYNDGMSFRFGPLVSWGFSSTPSLNTSIYRTSSSRVQVTGQYSASEGDTNKQCWAYAGTRTDSVRMLDVDSDGRVDMFDNTSEVNGPVLYFNGGGQLLGPVQASSTDPGQKTGALVLDGTAAGGGYSWYHNADFMDIDGDGVAEYVTTSSNTNTITSIKRADADHPMRLLRSIDNGRGAVTTVAYTPTTDHSVVTPPTPPKHQMPHIQWVVKSMTTTDPFAVSSTTTYHYDSPHWSPDDQSRWGFRGFDVVRTTSPRNAVTEDRYDYSVDWSGRLATTLVFPAESPASPTTISETVFTPETLFGGAITTFHTSMTRQWTCSPGQTEAQCRATPAGFTKEASSWKPMASTTVTGGPTLLYVESEHTKQDSETFNDGDRTTKTTYALDADGTTYRLRDTDAVSQVQTAGALVTSARVHKQYDSLWKVAQLTTNWFDATHSAASERTYDMTTGNVTMTREPEQYAANKAAYTEYKYDSKALFVAITNDALKHKVSTVYDYGTGALLRTIGPNYTNCTGICSTQSEEKRTDVDGLGRPIATYVATDSSTPGQYVLAQVTSTSYVDVGTATSPASVTTQQRVEYDENRWTKEKVELDAHGRPFRKTTYVQGTAPNDAVTTYQYDAIGKLTQVSVPNPATNSTDTVTYSYGSDSIGRPTSMRRPGAAPQSGLDITYQGVQETRTEVAGTDGGPASVTQLVHDPFGRLAAVREQLDDGTWATTTYSYDPQDNVSQIADPDGLVTYLDHDWGSRRIGIRRGNRTWTFGYDRNGNLTSETAPPPSSSSADVLAYTTTYSYDDLDRVKSKLVGSRWLSSADQDLLGVGELDYSYDTGINGTGRLVQVTTEVAPLPWTVRGFRSRGERVTRFVLDG